MTDFEIIWQQYPRKTAKAVARKAWHKLNPDTETVQQMIDALTWQTQTDQWRRGIIPHFSTWLNQARWEDEKPTARALTLAPEQREQAQRIHARRHQEFMTDAAQMAEDWYRTHPHVRPGKPS